MIRGGASMRVRQAAFLLTSLLFCALAQSAVAQDKPYSKWFRYGREAEAAWIFTADDGNPLQLSIRPKRPAANRPVKKVMVLYPRASSAYDTEITRDRKSTR